MAKLIVACYFWLPVGIIFFKNYVVYITFIIFMDVVRVYYDMSFFLTSVISFELE